VFGLSPVHQLDQIETPCHLVRRRIPEALIQERLELQDIQRKMDDQLTMIARLANQVIQNNSSHGLAFKDALDAVTFHSGTQLKEPLMPDPVAQAPSEKRYNNRDR
ncbi:hypothetical protein PIB30_104549, partial [Stylosanthes scabra]|nr:hypothetical protein [Stylosanthes scabra]